jgi:hypothetical protein
MRGRHIFSLVCGVTATLLGSNLASAAEAKIQTTDSVVSQATIAVVPLVFTLTNSAGQSICAVGATCSYGATTKLSGSKIGVRVVSAPSGQCSITASSPAEGAQMGTWFSYLSLPSGCTWRKGKTLIRLWVYDPTVSGYVGSAMTGVDAR